jgi:hypothetical protein
MLPLCVRSGQGPAAPLKETSVHRLGEPSDAERCFQPPALRAEMTAMRALAFVVLLAACAPQVSAPQVSAPQVSPVAAETAPAVRMARGSLFFNGERPPPVVDFGNVPELTSVRSYSIQAWVKFASLPTYATVFAQRRGDGDRAAMLQVGHLGENLATSIDGGYSQTPPHSLSVGRWYHCVVVYDGSLADRDRLKLYVDGVRQATAPGQPAPLATPPSATVFAVGAEYNQLTPITGDSSLIMPFTGNVSDVGIWINPLGSEEVAALYHAGVPADPLRNAGAYGSSATLAHYWRLDDGSGNVARDGKGKQPGHVINGAVWSTDAPSRSPATAVSLVPARADPVRTLHVAGGKDDPRRDDPRRDDLRRDDPRRDDPRRDDPPRDDPPRDRAPALSFDVDAIRPVDGTACPGGQTLVSVAEAAAHRDAVCAKLGPWDIVRLAGGGSMDGPGYHCGTRDHDDRSLGAVLCKPGARPARGAR